jgi:hypothetical protein
MQNLLFEIFVGTFLAMLLVKTLEEIQGTIQFHLWKKSLEARLQKKVKKKGKN